MSLRIKFELRGRCSKHPRYNPAKDGEAGIRGGCVGCHHLLKVYLITNGAMEEAEFLVKQQKDFGLRIPVLRYASSGAKPAKRN